MDSKIIPLYSTTIRRREMDAVLTCMVDEKIGPGQMNARLVQSVKDFFGALGCAGAVALRSPAIALRYALDALGVERGDGVMISALAPSWQLVMLERLGYKCVVLDVNSETALVTAQAVEEGMKSSGRVLLLHETCGLVPQMDAFLGLGVPIIEDISQSVGATVVAEDEAEGTAAVHTPVASTTSSEGVTDSGEIKARKAGTFGQYTILGLEEHDAVTAGGGAVLIAPKRREWMVLEHKVNEAPVTDLLPDLNSALAAVELKEFAKNEARRKEIYTLYQRTALSTPHGTFPRDVGTGDVAAAFPLVLAHSYPDAKEYADSMEVEIERAFSHCVLAIRDEELSPACPNAKSLALRTVLLPLYARLTAAQVQKVIRVMSAMP